MHKVKTNKKEIKVPDNFNMKWGGSFLPCFRNKFRGYIILSYKTILKIFTVYFEVLLIIKYCVNLFIMRLHLYITWVISKINIAKG